MLSFRSWQESVETDIAQTVSQNPNLNYKDITKLMWNQGHNISSSFVSYVMKQLKPKQPLIPKALPTPKPAKIIKPIPPKPEEKPPFMYRYIPRNSSNLIPDKFNQQLAPEQIEADNERKELKYENPNASEKQIIMMLAQSIYRKKPSLADVEIASIIEPNVNKRKETFDIVSKALWTIRGIPRLIRKILTDQPGLTPKTLMFIAQLMHKEENIQKWMVDLIIQHEKQNSIVRW